MGFIAQDGEWYPGQNIPMNTNDIKIKNLYIFLGKKYETFEEMKAAVKLDCEKLNKTIVK